MTNQAKCFYTGLSDHGYNLGEHDSWSKVSLWEGSVRVPLIISAPGQEYQKQYGTTSRVITELIDLYPTLTELAGLAAETPKRLQGKSFARYLTTSESALQERNGEAYTVSYQGRAASIRTDRWRYTRWGEDAGNGNEELYDHKRDSEEHVNLADDPDYKNILDEMRKKLDSRKQEIQHFSYQAEY